MPELESNTRLAQQLAQLAKGSALLDGRAEVSDGDFELVRRVAFDCIPPARKLIIEALLRGESATSVKIPASTCNYALEELEAQDLTVGRRTNAQLSESTVDMLTLAGLIH